MTIPASIAAMNQRKIATSRSGPIDHLLAVD
jgi:hypothetical protein